MADKKKSKVTQADLYARYGEFDSVEEINAKAKELKAAGDFEGVRTLASENGQDPEEAEDFINGDIPELFFGIDPDRTAINCALCKLNNEEQSMEPQELIEDWIDYIRFMTNEDPTFARQVRKKGKSLAGAIAALLKWSFAHQWDVPRQIMQAAGVNVGKCTLGVPGMRTAKAIMQKYYNGVGEGNVG